jgi:hypothetical protein
MPNHDKELVEVTCCDCGIPILIRYGTFRKTTGSNHRCRKCRGKAERERINNLPEKERELYLKKKNDAIRLGWNNQSKDKKESISNNRKESWNNNSERQLKHSEMLRSRWNNMDDHSRQELIKKLNDGKIKYWNNPDNVLHRSNQARDKWYSQTPEDQLRILKSLETGRREFYSNLTTNQREGLSRKQSEGLRRYWSSLPPDEYEKRLQVFREKLKENFDTLNLIPNKNERMFISYLNSYYIDYTFIWYNSIKHKKFDELFGNNPLKPGSKVSPFHGWDFKINTLYDPILVDIDGSIHDIKCTSNNVKDSKGNTFKLSDYIQFKDSQRLYQTDGLDAYVVQCYDDNLTDDTPVLNIKTGKVVTLISFIGILLLLNMNEDDIDSLIHDI